MSSSSYEYTSSRHGKVLLVAAAILFSLSQFRTSESARKIVTGEGGSLFEKAEHRVRKGEEEGRSSEEVLNTTFDTSNGQRNATSDESIKSTDSNSNSNSNSNNDDDDDNDNDNKVIRDPNIENQTAFLEFLELEHPECVSKGKKIRLGKHGTYAYRPPEESQNALNARYDHSSCFVMKARYNCASSRSAADPERSARNYRLLFRHPGSADAGDLCDVREAMAGFARRRRASSPVGLVPAGTSVLLQGNSFLRQVWEALVCLFDGELEDLSLNEFGPSLTAKDLGVEKNLQIEDLGSAMNLSRARKEGCHGNDAQKVYEKAYSQPGIDPPTTASNRNCNDDIALAKFGRGFRVGYLFRPYSYGNETLEHIFENRLRMMADDPVDFMVFNDMSSRQQGHPRTVWDWDAVVSTLRRVQNRSVGRYFGANNPWIFDPPDEHPCMPGIPDDEAYLLLFCILTGYEIV